jgi:hypothetical protein
MRTSLVVAALFAFLLASFAAMPAAAAAQPAWGNILDRNFTTDIVYGLRTSGKPYYGSSVTSTLPNNCCAFVFTVVSEYWWQQGWFGYQIALVSRANTRMMDVYVQHPTWGAAVRTCELCKDGTLNHEWKIARTNYPGWTLYMDGSSSMSDNCACFSTDKVHKGIRQIPWAFEGIGNPTQANIDNNFRSGRTTTLSYQRQIGSGTWYSVAHAKAYYHCFFPVCDHDFEIGDTEPAAWASVGKSDGPFKTEVGTTTYVQPKIQNNGVLW